MWGFGSMNTITVDSYDKLKASGEPFIMLDVRDPEEFREGHMENAINIPLHVLPLKAQELLSDKNMKIITSCMRGGRSGQAAVYLTEAGYTDAAVLDGGYFGYIGK